MEEIYCSNTPDVTGIGEWNKSQSQQQLNFKIGSKLEYLKYENVGVTMGNKKTW